MAYNINNYGQPVCTSRESTENPGRLVKKSHCNTRPSQRPVYSYWGEAARRLAAAVHGFNHKYNRHGKEERFGSARAKEGDYSQRQVHPGGKTRWRFAENISSRF